MFNKNQVISIALFFAIPLLGYVSACTNHTYELELGSIQFIPSNEAMGFHTGFYCFIPNRITNSEPQDSPFYMLVLFSNTDKPTSTIEPAKQAAYNLIAHFKRYAMEMPILLLTPVIPRLNNHPEIYSQALDRDVFTTSNPKLHRVDLQVLASIDFIRAKLAQKSLKVAKKILVFGFSAGGMFANRFSLLHAEHVQAACVGSPGGWPIAPVETWQQNNLPYPVGTYDLEELSRKTINYNLYKQIPQYFFIGSKDDNDSVDYRDGYSKELQLLIDNLFGTEPQTRWHWAETIYQTVGCAAEFVRYDAIGHALDPIMEKDVIQFLKKSIRATP